MRAADRVIVDTSALYALISSTDEFHATARGTYDELLTGDSELWTTSYVLVEFGALVHHRLGFNSLRTFVESTEGVFDTVWIDETLHAEAWKQLLQREGRGLNFLDWTSLLAARSLQATIFTFDTGFASEGAAVIPRSA